MSERTLTGSGHTSDCPGDSNNEPCADPVSTHTDIFCEGCHDWFDEPRVLPNGTDIAWPSTWSRTQADQWRAEHNLIRPNSSQSNIGQKPAAGPHDKPELTTEATDGTGMLPSTGSASDDDMAPGG